MKLFTVSGKTYVGLYDFDKADYDLPPGFNRTVKRVNGDLDQAGDMLRATLLECQTSQHYDGIIYVSDMMANLAFNMRDYDQAESLFTLILQRLIAKGLPEDDVKVLRIKLKLAKLRENLGDTQKAEDGYKFCIEKLENHMTKLNEDDDDDNGDVALFFGISLDWYASMLFSQSRYDEAIKYLSQAHELSVKRKGEKYDHSVMLLNDLGAINYIAGDYDTAIEHLSKAAEIGKELDEYFQLGSVYINLGHAFLKKGSYEDAKKYCDEGKILAEARDHKDSLVEVESCLNELEKLEIER